MTIAIKVKNLTKHFKLYESGERTIFQSIKARLHFNSTYSNFTALKNVSFEVEKGELIGIIGPNGAGKTTLLKLIANILHPTKGRIITNGKIVPLLELGSSFQEDLSVRDNIFLYGTFLGLTNREIKKRFDRIIAFSGLKNFVNSNIRILSDGMKLRLAFSIIKEIEGDIYLLDEILSVGDEEFQRKCFTFFEKLKKQKKTILLVTHNLDVLTRVCDKALFLKKGFLLHKKTPKIIAKEYREEVIEKEIVSIKRRIQAESSKTKLVDLISDLKSIFKELIINTENDKHRFGLIKKFDKISVLAISNNSEMKKDVLEQKNHLLRVCYDISDAKEKTLFRSLLEKNLYKTFLISDQENSLKNIKHHFKVKEFNNEDVRITNVFFTDRFGKKRGVFYSWEEMSIELEYHAGKRIKMPMFGIAIFDSKNNLLVGPNTTFSTRTKNEIFGFGVVSYKIKSLPLLDGTYYVSASIYDKFGLEKYDLHDKQYHFKVSNKKLKSLGGVIDFKGDWFYK